MMDDSEALLGGPKPTQPRWMTDATETFKKPPSPSTRRLIITLVVVLSLIGLAWLLPPLDTKTLLHGPPPNPECPAQYIDSLPTCKAADGSMSAIPNIVHYVFLLKDPNADFPFQFSHFLSMYGAWRLWQPDTIFLHTNAAADSAPVRRARSGAAGKWNKLVFNIPGLVVNTVEMPETAGNGVNITMMEHKSDFIRVRMVHEHGGVYIDLDVQPLRDVAALRTSGYRAVGGREFGHRDDTGEDHVGALNSGTFMSVAGGAMITRWMERMNDVFDGEWVTHSNKALTSVAEELEAEQGESGCEMLELGRKGFAPGSWKKWDVDALFYEHDDTASTVSTAKDTESLRPGGPIPSEVDPRPGTAPDWAIDYSCTYLLHAFSPKKARNGAKNNGITPRYVLERKSNYARATYPVVRDMYNEGLVGMGDTDVGV